MSVVPTLSQLCRIRAGATLRGNDAAKPRPDGIYRLIRIGDLTAAGSITRESVVAITPRESISPEQLLRSTDVLVAARGSRNTAAAFNQTWTNAIAGSQFFILRVNDGLDPNFLAWFLRSERIRRHFDTRRKGSHVPLIQVADLAEIEMPLPPLATQRRLVEIARLSEQEHALSARIAHLHARYFDALLHRGAFASA